MTLNLNQVLDLMDRIHAVKKELFLLEMQDSVDNLLLEMIVRQLEDEYTNLQRQLHNQLLHSIPSKHK